MFLLQANFHHNMSMVPLVPTTLKTHFRKVGPFTNTTILLVDSLGRGSIGDPCLRCIQEHKSMLFLCEYIASWSVRRAKEVYIRDEELKLNTYYQRVVLVLSKSQHGSTEINCSIEPSSIKRDQPLNG